MASQFTYKKVLLIGATSGIGHALATRMIQHGVHVIVVGRRQERLDAFVKEHGPTKASGMAFDINDLPQIPSWADKVHKAHPDLDCVMVNSGFQRDYNFADPKSVDLEMVNDEFTTNYLSQVHLAMAFLPYLELQSKTSPAAFEFTTSGLALVPTVSVSNYCATKAALHAWILCFRQQLKNQGSKVKVIEILPPAVQTELHDRDPNGRSLGMPLDEFTDHAWDGLTEGVEQIPVGTSKPHFAPDGFETLRQKKFYSVPMNKG